MKFNIYYSKKSHRDFFKRNISEKYPWCRKEYNQAWQKIAEDLKFEKIWQCIKNDLPKAKSRLEKLLRRQKDKIEKIVKIISVLYHKPLPKDFKLNIWIILLPQSVKSGGGGFGPDERTVRVEGSLERFSKIKTIEIILHELIHAYFEKGYFKDKLYPKCKNKLGYHTFKELVACALLPNGYLSKIIFHQKINLSKPSCLIRPYVKQKRALDRAFARENVF